MRKKTTKKKKNYHIATLLRQQSKVLGKCKIDEVGTTLRLTFVHLLYNLHVPCPATRNETLLPFSFHGRCRWYLRLCVQVFWGLICVGRGEVVACSLTEEGKKNLNNVLKKTTVWATQDQLFLLIRITKIAHAKMFFFFSQKQWML